MQMALMLRLNSYPQQPPDAVVFDLQSYWKRGIIVGMKDIQEVGIEMLKPYEKNAKQHPGSQVEKIANSIREFGFNQPIVADRDGVIIVGHGRYQAALLLGLEKVPVAYLDISQSKANAYRLADNRLNESEWDMDLVIEELKTLDDNLIDLTGFSKDLLIEPDEQDDVVPTGASGTIVNVGQVWKCGPHRLMCGDSTSPEDVAKLIANNKADMVFTDPRYNVNYKGSKDKAWEGIIGDHVSDEDFAVFLDKVFKNYRTAIKDGGSMYVFHSPTTATIFEAMLIQNGFEVKSTLIWNKPYFNLGMSDYRSKHEPFFYAGVAGIKSKFYGDRTHSTVIDLEDNEDKLLSWVKREKRLQREGKTTIWTMKRESITEYVHPTQKPVELITYALANSSKEGDIVLDLFGGSGSTMIAANKTGRIAYIMELDPKFVETMLTRFAQYTKEDPVRESDGRKWSDLYDWKKGMSEEMENEDFSADYQDELNFQNNL